jgi:hypothetical protein
MQGRMSERLIRQLGRQRRAIAAAESPPLTPAAAWRIALSSPTPTTPGETFSPNTTNERPIKACTQSFRPWVDRCKLGQNSQDQLAG